GRKILVDSHRARTKATPRNQLWRNPGSAATKPASPQLAGTQVKKGDPECPARIRTRASRTRTRVRSPASSRVAARSPDSSGSKIRTVRAKNRASKTPISRAKADVRSDINPSERARKVPPKGGTFLFG